MKLRLLVSSGGSTSESVLTDGGVFAVGDTGADAALTVRVGESVTTLAVSASGSFRDDVSMIVEADVAGIDGIYYPAFSGSMEHSSANGVVREFRGPGWVASDLYTDSRLSIPMAVVSTAEGLFLWGTDPRFTARLSATATEQTSALRLEWTYRHEAGSHDGLSRAVIWQSVASLEEALSLWFELATPTVPAPPAWLKEIALVDYDYMSKNGDGWYADIDAACEIIDEKDRHRAMFTLHGWYDAIGHYSIDQTTGAADSSWTVFPHIQDPQLLASQGIEAETPGRPRTYNFRNLVNYHPIQMTWDDIRARLTYARERGFRTAFYVMCGLMDLGDSSTNLAAGKALDVPVELWVGPDAIEPSYLMNPLHPEIRARVRTLMSALVREVGELTDAYVFDEAYYIGYGDLGPEACPGYADLAQATLLQEMAAIIHEFNPQIALLTADHVGTPLLDGRAYPYALFTDGVYHDAWSQAQPYIASRFSSWRGTVFSCNWAPITALDNTRWAVVAYGAPVSISNGCMGDDIGLAEMDATSKSIIESLWRVNMSRTQHKSVPVVEVDYAPLAR